MGCLLPISNPYAFFSLSNIEATRKVVTLIVFIAVLVTSEAQRTDCADECKLVREEVEGTGSVRDFWLSPLFEERRSVGIVELRLVCLLVYCLCKTKRQNRVSEEMNRKLESTHRLYDKLPLSDSPLKTLQLLAAFACASADQPAT
jgi:hypothetical protein